MTSPRNTRPHEGVPSIAELRPTAQGSKTEADRRWMYRSFRHISIYVTWLFLHTRITPNQVTLTSLLVGVTGLIMVAAPSAGVAIGGCALLLVYHLFDRVDGEVARYRKTYSLYGIYLDNAGHYLIGAGLLLAATYRLAPISTEPQAVWLLGSIGAFATMLSRVEKHAPFHLFSQYVLEQPELLETLPHATGDLTRESAKTHRSQQRPTLGTKTSILIFMRNALLTATSFPVTTFLLMAGFGLEMVFGTVSTALAALMVVVVLQAIAYVGIELANLTQNLGAESRRLARIAGIPADDTED